MRRVSENRKGGGTGPGDYVMQVVIVMYFGWKFETDVRESFGV